MGCSRSARAAALIVAAVLSGAGTAAAELTLASRGATDFVIAAGSSPADRHAAADLQRYLQQMTGAPFAIAAPSGSASRRAIVIASGVTDLAADEVSITVEGERVLLAGGGPRGSLVAVYRFLHELGCRWWAPGAESIPSVPVLKVSGIAIRETPAFRWREVLLPSANNVEWAGRNLIDAPVYAGFVHTFRDLVPPAVHFKSHPEWYSLVDGARTALPNRSQLCLSNHALRRFVAARVRERLRANPQAQIASVSQNDGRGFCECGACRLLYAKYGAPSGALLEFVNEIAATIEPEFPAVIIDTLAYVDTRRPPRGIRARANVAVRVCCIECDEGVPLDHQRNAAFAAELDAWRKVAARLHAWDYMGNYNEYMLPHPNWFVTGQTLRFLQSRGVAAVFVLGVPPSPVSELHELRAWTTARLMWNPRHDAGALVDEFLEGYYGAASAKPIRAYLDLMTNAAASEPLSPYNSAEKSAFLRFPLLAEAEQLWQEAERLAPDAELARRVRLGHASVRYAWLVRWDLLRREAAATKGSWPLPASRKEVAAAWLAVMRSGGVAEAPLEEFAAHLTAEELVRLVSIHGSTNDGARPRIVPTLPMPHGLVAVAGLLIAFAFVLRVRFVTLWIAALSCATGGVICYWRFSTLTFRYATLVVVLSIIAIACALAALAMKSPRSAVTTAAFFIGTFALVSTPAFVKARIVGSRNLAYASLDRANLTHAIFHGSDLRGAHLRGAHASNAILNFANLDGADLRQADFRSAMMVYTSLRGADLRGTDLRDAVFRDPTHTLFRGALYDSSTRFPRGFDPRDWDMRWQPIQ